MNFIRKIFQAHSEKDEEFYNELKKLLNFSPKSINKYKKAFTHRSVQMLDRKGIPINYERLEFLGDSILGSSSQCMDIFVLSFLRQYSYSNLSGKP